MTDLTKDPAEPVDKYLERELHGCLGDAPPEVASSGNC